MKNRLLEAAERLYGFKPGERTRKRERVNIRQVLAYLLTTEAGLTLKYAGKVLGGFDHSNIHYAKKEVMARMETKDPTTLEVIREIKTELNPPVIWIGKSVMSTDFKKTLIG